MQGRVYIRTPIPIPMDTFDIWNSQKKKIHFHDVKRHFKERDIYYARVGHNVGFEQNGRGVSFLRPVVILRKFNDRLFWGIPLTRTKKKGDYYYSFSFTHNKMSTAILSQLRLFDSHRLMHKIGMISPIDFENLKKKTSNLLG